MIKPDEYETKFALETARKLKKYDFIKLLSSYSQRMFHTPSPFAAYDQNWWAKCYSNPRQAELYREKFWITPDGGQNDLQSKLNKLLANQQMRDYANVEINRNHHG